MLITWSLVFLAAASALANLALWSWFRRELARREKLEEERKFALAEANLKLLEQSELVEAQKFQMAEANITLMEQKELIEMERERSEKLLLNILPAKIANDLKERGRAEPESFDNVSALFSDIVGFTSKAVSIEPKRLIEELNELFTAFDRIAARNGCERIKTIGDAYLCVCGMPIPDPFHATKIVKTAAEMVAWLRARNEKAELKWEIRVGVDSGSVVGGVVGIDKYIYDVFGDTINTASRMESHSAPMRVNLSAATYTLVKDELPCLEREIIEVKGKGDLKMYFVAF